MKLKKIISGLVPVLLIGGGLAAVLYPWISEYLYEHKVDSVAESYEETARETDDSDKERMLEEAYRYNEWLANAKISLSDPFTEESVSDQDYLDILNQDDSGIMAFIDIPKINVYLPVYHGTSSEVLEQGVGHLEGSSFPVGGDSTHAVLSAHTGLNKAKLFTDLTAMEEGDYFFIHVLGDTLAYEVNDIQVVEPDDVSSLAIREGEDLVTLVTCTPYGVNSHRLLVTGERTEYTEEVMESAQEETVNTESQWMDSYKKALIIGILAAIALFVMFFLIRKAVKKRQLKNGIGGDGYVDKG